MSKRLVLLFCALFVMAAAVPAFAAVQNVKVSGDILARYIARDNFDLLKGNGATGEDQIGVFNTATRVRIDADLTDNVSTVVRLINERNWDQATASTTDIDLDLAYVTMKEFLCSPLTLTIGRQELHFGNDMIIGDGVGNPTAALVAGGVGTNQTTNYTEATGYGGVNGDLALRKSFDAIRATLNYDPLVIDLVYAKVLAGAITGAKNNDDTNLYGINAGYKLNDKYNSLVEGYIWNKVRSSQTGMADKDDIVTTVGGRISTNPVEKLNLQQELAWQGGQHVTATASRDRNAWASQSMATVTPGWRHNPVIGVIYSYFSGDAGSVTDNPDKTYHGWDPMFENQTAGSIINALFSQTNCHNIDVMGKISPDFLKDVTLRADWVIQMLAKGIDVPGATITTDYGTQNYATDKKMLGQELDLTVTYDYTEDVQFGLLTGFFDPSKALVKADRQTATQAIVSCKVSF